MSKKGTALGLAVMALLASSVFAGVHTIAPSLNWSDGYLKSDPNNLAAHDAWAGAVIGDYWGYEYRNFQKFDIPVYPGEVITNVMVNIDVKVPSNGGWDPGVNIDLRDNNWDTTSNKPVYGSPVVAGTQIINRYPNITNDSSGEGLISSDITAYLTRPGRGQGYPLSIRISRENPKDPTPRGAGLGTTGNWDGCTLTITTEPTPPWTSPYTIKWSDRRTAGTPTDTTPQAVIGSYWGLWEYHYYEKFNIPVFPGEVITKVMVNVNSTTSSNGDWDPGIYLDLRDDHWNGDWDTNPSAPLALYYDPVFAGTQIINRLAKDDGTGLGLVSSDITAWVKMPGKGQGHPISIRYGRENPKSSTPRGSYLETTAGLNDGLTLTIWTVPGVEPTPTPTPAPRPSSVEIKLPPAVQGRLATGTGLFDSNLIAGLWSTGTPGGENQAYAKFNIPTSENTIRRLDLCATQGGQYDWQYMAGLTARRVANDSWTAGSITYNWPYDASSTVTMFAASDNVCGEVGATSTKDIVSYLEVSGEGPGAPLSLRLDRTGAGSRGIMLDNLSLTVGYVSRGHRTLLDRGLQIQALVFPDVTGSFDLVRWASSNFTTVNTHAGINPSYLGAAPGIPWACWGFVSPEDMPYVSNLVSLQYSDEQDMSDPDNVTNAAAYLAKWRHLYPNVIGFTNQRVMNPVPTEATLAAYMAAAQPDMLSFDWYPFDGGTVGGSPTDQYAYLQKWRLLALAGNDGSGKYPIPYGTYLQTITRSGHAPSDSEMRLNQFSAWAFGYTFTCAFIYESNNSTLTPTLFTGPGDGTPTAAFSQIAATNRMSRNLGQSLVRLLSTDIRIVRGQHGGGVSNTLPAGMADWAAGADPYITGISAVNLGSKNGGFKGDVLVGYFKPLLESDDGPGYTQEKYFMIVNGLSDAAGLASETQQTITLNFNFGTSGITRLKRLSRTTGLVETVPLVHDSGSQYHLALTLEGGTGDLFKFDTGAAFVGVQVIGDANGDGVVNAADLSAVLAAMDTAGSSPIDQDGDGQITSTDLAIVLANLP